MPLQTACRPSSSSPKEEASHAPQHPCRPTPTTVGAQHDALQASPSNEKRGNIFRLGIFLVFVRLTTRRPHGAYVKMSGRNRVDPHWWTCTLQRACRQTLGGAALSSQVCKRKRHGYNQPLPLCLAWPIGSRKDGGRLIRRRRHSTLPAGRHHRMCPGPRGVCLSPFQLYCCILFLELLSAMARALCYRHAVVGLRARAVLLSARAPAGRVVHAAERARPLRRAARARPAEAERTRCACGQVRNG